MYRTAPTYPINAPVSFVQPSGQAAAPAPTVEQLQGALSSQKSATNLSLALAIGALGYAIYKHYSCALSVARTETEYLRRSERQSRGRAMEPYYGQQRSFGQVDPYAGY